MVREHKEDDFQHTWWTRFDTDAFFGDLLNNTATRMQGKPWGYWRGGPGALRGEGGAARATPCGFL